jgi:hypothetical protein
MNDSWDMQRAAEIDTESSPRYNDDIHLDVEKKSDIPGHRFELGNTLRSSCIAEGMAFEICAMRCAVYGDQMLVRGGRTIKGRKDEGPGV